MLKELCATLLILCNPILSGFDFDYEKDDKDMVFDGTNVIPSYAGSYV